MGLGAGARVSTGSKDPDKHQLAARGGPAGRSQVWQRGDVDAGKAYMKLTGESRRLAGHMGYLMTVWNSLESPCVTQSGV